MKKLMILPLTFLMLVCLKAESNVLNLDKNINVNSSVTDVSSLTLKGQLTARWGKVFQDDYETYDMKLFVQFYPEKKSTTELKLEQESITLNYGEESHNINVVKQFFEKIPEHFWFHKEGI